MNRSLLTVACFVGLAISRIASAADYSAADALFEARSATDRAGVNKAITAYETALSGSTGAERVYGLSRVSQLYVFEGAYGAGLTKDEKKDYFDKCYDLAERLKPDNFQNLKVPQYYFFRTLCLAQWGLLETNPLKKLARIPSLKSLVNAGLAQADAQQLYYGYGIRRVVAAIRINPSADIAGLYDKAEGLKMLADSGDGILSPTNLDKNYEDDTLLVRDYVDIYRYRAEALVANGLKADAKTLLDKTIASIVKMQADGTLPAGHEQETVGELALMQEARAAL